MLFSGDFINVLCSPETDFVIVYTDFIKYCQSRMPWFCIHVALVRMTITATVLTSTSDFEVQHPKNKRTTCHRIAWTTNTLQLRLATGSYPSDTEQSNTVSSGLHSWQHKSYVELTISAFFIDFFLDVLFLPKLWQLQATLWFSILQCFDMINCRIPDIMLKNQMAQLFLINF